jgi:multiple sugar transport system permease protein
VIGRSASALRPASGALAVRRRKETLSAYLFLLPGFTLFGLVILYPIARAFQISLYHWAIVPGAPSQWAGIHNYSRALHDPVFWRGLVNTGFYMAVTVPAQIVLGLAVAVLLDGRMPARAFFRTLFYLPVVTSWVVVSLLFRYLFLTDGGLVNWFLHDGLHVTGHNIDWLDHRWSAMTVIAVLGVWKGIGWSMVIFLAALQGVPRELKEAAAVDGANAWRRFRAVSLPAIRPVVAFVTVMLVIGGFNVFISVFLITNGGPLDETQVLLTYMYRQAFSFLDFGYGSAISFTLTLIVFAVSLAQLRLFRRPAEAS